MCARQFWLLAAQLNFELDIKHKPGHELVDALSRSPHSKAHKLKAQQLCDSLKLIEVPVHFGFHVLDFSL